MKKCRLLAVLVAFCSLTGPVAAQDAEATPSLADTVTRQGVRAHMAAFERIAAMNGGTRAAGTPGYAASLRYAEGLLQDAGYTLTRQAFTIETSRTLAETGSTVGAAPTNIEPVIMEGSSNTPTGGLEAPLARPRDPLGCSPDDFGDVRGDVVLLTRGVCTFGEKAANAAAAGARAALIANTDDEPLRTTLGDTPATVPTAGITARVGEQLSGALARGETRVRLELRTSRAVRPTANLIAQWPGERRESIVMLGAHLDSVEAGPGINDNGSGSALVLELALRLAQTGSAAGARFAFWGAEELGLLGSRHYVAQLSSDDIRALRAYLNFDMVSSPNGALFSYGDPELTALFEASLARRGLSAAPTDLNSSSDHAPFNDVGIPVAGLFTGASGDKSPGQAGRFGGAARTPYGSCYHAACDTLRGATTRTSQRVLEPIADAAADALQSLLREVR